MSAYVNGRGSHIFSLNGGSTGASTPEAPLSMEQLPALPQIAHELEAYFILARQMEAALAHERVQTRKMREELQEFQHKQGRLSVELENRMREAGLKEERYKTQISTFQQTERGLHEQVSELCRQIESLREEKKKTEMEAELGRANLENFKRREMSLRATLRAHQLAEKTRIEKNEKTGQEFQAARSELHQELQAVRKELNRYQVAWSQVVAMDQKAKQLVQDYYESKKRLDEFNEALGNEKKRRENLEELLNKEKREKQLALSCLHTAESRLAQANRELEELRNQRSSQKEQNQNQKPEIFGDSIFELKF